MLRQLGRREEARELHEGASSVRSRLRGWPESGGCKPATAEPPSLRFLRLVQNITRPESRIVYRMDRPNRG